MLRNSKIFFPSIVKVKINHIIFSMFSCLFPVSDSYKAKAVNWVSKN